MFWSDWLRKIGPKCWIVIGDWCMPWWKKVKLPEDMNRPDSRTEKVIERLEVVAERMEAVAQILSDDLDTHDEEQRELQRIVREAQGRARKGSGASGRDISEDRGDSGGSID